MADDLFDSPNRKPPSPRQPRPPGEPLWEFRHNHLTWSAELHDETPHGWDCHLLRDSELFKSRRFANRKAAIAWANTQRGTLRKLDRMSGRNRGLAS